MIIDDFVLNERAISRIAAANERLQESFDGLAYLPLAFAAVLGFFVLATALLEDPALAGFAGRVSDSGEGRWTIKAAIDEAVPAPVLTAALYGRFASRGDADFQNRLLSALRWQFGGHREKPAA